MNWEMESNLNMKKTGNQVSGLAIKYCLSHLVFIIFNRSAYGRRNEPGNIRLSQPSYAGLIDTPVPFPRCDHNAARIQTRVAPLLNGLAMERTFSGGMC